MRFYAVIFVYVVILIAIVSSVHAETFMNGMEINDSRLVKSLTLKISDEGTIQVTSGHLKWVKINITVPQKAVNQQVSYSDELVQDEIGNNFVYIYNENPLSNTVNYLSETYVIVNSQVTTSIPSSYTISLDAKRYLLATKNIQSDNDDIKDLAESITRGSQSDFEKVAKLAIWVNEYLTYDLAYSNVILDAVSVLNTKAGVCAEYTTLFVALSRASDIPARYVSGFAYGDNGWEEHAYSEVYLGKWVPVDALWLEVGNLDATHIRYTVQLDNQVKNDVKVYGSDLGEIVWVKDDKTINTVSVSYVDYISDFYFGASTLEVEPGDDIIFYAKIPQDDYRVLDLSMQPCLSDSAILIIDEKEKRVIIEAGSNDKIVYWVGHVSDNLAKNMVYTCPVTFNSRFLENRVVDVVISYQNKSSVVLNPFVSKPVINLGDQQEIVVGLKRFSGNDPISIGIVSSDYFDEGMVDLSLGSEKDVIFMFKPKHLGENNVVVYSSTGDIRMVSFDVVEKGSVYIESLEYDEIIRVNEASSINITIVNDKASDETVKLFYGTSIETLDVPSNSLIVVEYVVDTSVVGTTIEAVKITGQGIIDAEYVDIIVYDIPLLAYDYSYDYSLMKLSFVILVESDYAENLVVSIDGVSSGHESVLGAHTFSFDVVPGAYDVALLWEDRGGNLYSDELGIVVGSENIIAKIIRLITEFIERI
ncbi:MAG: transglutaminase-like domain-containing protein [DPANN group archaeon]|nr:transglutaminase-like domain-containing protein [DPANN group archaeon]